jgi:hypothetical protein
MNRRGFLSLAFRATAVAMALSFPVPKLRLKDSPDLVFTTFLVDGNATLTDEDVWCAAQFKNEGTYPQTFANVHDAQRTIIDLYGDDVTGMGIKMLVVDTHYKEYTAIEGMHSVAFYGCELS